LVNSVLSQYGNSLVANVDETVFITFESAQMLLRTPYFSGVYIVTILR